MRFLVIIVLPYTETAYACIVGLQKILSTENMGFTLNEHVASEFCEACSSISVMAPTTYQDILISHATFTTYIDNILISKWLTYFAPNAEEHAFYGIVNKAITYTV